MHHVGPVFGPRNGSSFYCFLRAGIFPQATAVWNWIGYLRERSSKPLLLLNLDETGVPLFAGDKPGTLLRSTPRVLQGTATGELVQFCTTHEARGQATHIAII